MGWNIFFGDKRGASAHFEMVVAFVFFLTFMTFLMVFILPSGNSSFSTSVVFALHSSFLEKTQTDLTKIFLRADYPTLSPNCFYVVLNETLIGVNLDGMKTYIKDLNGNYRESELVDDNLKITKGNSLTDVDEFCFRVLVSSVFSENSLDSCTQLTDYKIGSVYETKAISFELLEQVEEEYENGYDGLKAKLKIPSSYDFSIVSDLVSMQREIPQGVEVYAEEYVEDVLYSNGTIINKRFVFSVW